MKASSRARYLLPLALIACGRDTQTAQVRRFQRPNQMELVCTHPSTGEALALSQCKDPSPVDPPRLFGLVTQSARGEIAAVDLATGIVVDSRRDIPGYTYVPVGEQPVAVIVPPGSRGRGASKHPQHTYVASFGSRDIRVFKTRDLLKPSGERKPVDVLSLELDIDGVHVRAAPTAMVLAPDEDALLVSSAEAGRVLRLPLTRCDDDVEPSECLREGLFDLDGIASVALDGSRALAPAAEPAQPNPASYAELCGASSIATVPAPSPKRSATLADGTAPRPSGMALDAFCVRDAEACTRRLLVADGAWPLIHVIDLDAIAPGSHGSDALQTPLAVSVPTRAVAVTPRVPRSLDSADGEIQYAYAIDASDGSVLAVELGSGHVVAVNADPGRPSDRIPFAPASQERGQAAAAALAVLTPSFDVGKEDAHQYVNGLPVTASALAGDPQLVCVSTADATPTSTRLRGVFLAVALTDGTLRIVDVHDMELRPKDNAQYACRACDAAPGFPLLARHRARLQNALPSLPFEPIALGFHYRIGGDLFDVRTDGRSASSAGPSLECRACPDGLARAFPSAEALAAAAAANDTSAPNASAAGSSAAIAGQSGAGVAGTSAGGPDAGAAGGSALSGATDACAQPGAALLCGRVDPWSYNNGEWFAATYGGLIPGTQGGGALLGPNDAPELSSELGFCSAGVLGTDAIRGEADACDPKILPTLIGDQLSILSPFTSNSEGCETLSRTLNEEQLPLAFEILSAREGRLLLAPKLLLPPNVANTLRTLADFESVKKCLGTGAIRFQVQAHDMFVVEGSTSGFQHRVKAGADGVCAIDRDASVLRRGRAIRGCDFQNQTIALRFSKPVANELAPRPGVQLQLQTSSPMARLVLNAAEVGAGYPQSAIVTTQLRYEEVTNRLFMVDVQTRGVIPVPLEAFPALVGATYY